MASVKKKTSKKGIGKKKAIIALIACFVLAGIGIYFYLSQSHASNCDGLPYGAKKTICYANLYIGTKESPAGSNKGSSINLWNTRAGCSRGSAWCASFVSDMVRYGRGSTNVRTCSTAVMVSLFGKNGHQVIAFGPKKVIYGDVLYRPRPTGGHVALVTSVSTNGTFTTIEGNTACASGGNDCVRARSYNADGSPTDPIQKNNGVGSWTKILRW